MIIFVKIACLKQIKSDWEEFIMNKLARRLLSAALAGVLMAGMCMTASAFTFPQAFWPLQ